MDKKGIKIVEAAFNEVANKKSRVYSTYLGLINSSAEGCIKREINIRNPNPRKDRFDMSAFPNSANPIFVVMANIENSSHVFLEEVTHLKVNQEATNKVMRPLMQVRSKETIL